MGNVYRRDNDFLARVGEVGLRDDGDVTVDEVRRLLSRPANVGEVGGFRPPDDPRTSWLGQVRVIGRGETWPTADGTPLAGVCQVNVAELASVPEALHGLVLMTLFMEVVDGLVEPNATWEVRTYARLDGVASVEPVVAPAVRPFPVRWHAVEDMPAWEDASSLLDLHDPDAYSERPHDGLKVGGWPTLIQGRTHWEPEDRRTVAPQFVWQVDSDDKTGIAWGDAGVLHLARGTADPSVWAMSWDQM